jgi:hypothetical protein
MGSDDVPPTAIQLEASSQETALNQLDVITLPEDVLSALLARGS